MDIGRKASFLCGIAGLVGALGCDVVVEGDAPMPGSMLGVPTTGAPRATPPAAQPASVLTPPPIVAPQPAAPAGPGTPAAPAGPGTMAGQPGPAPASAVPGEGAVAGAGAQPMPAAPTAVATNPPGPLPAQGPGETPSHSGGNPPAEPGPAHAPTFHVFLLLGQSNMEGYPKAQAADRERDERIRVLGYDDCAATGRRRDQWAVAAPPLHSCWNDGLGPGDYFAKTLIEVLPEGDTIGLVPCAINGERIETFLKDGGSKYAWILERAKLAQAEGGVIDGILFHQGESNNGDPSWPGKVNSLVEDLKADLELGDIPLVAGELLYSGSGAGHNRLIRQLPEVVDNAHVVSAEGLLVDPSDVQWRLHFGRDAQVSLGMRYAQKMIEAQAW